MKQDPKYTIAICNYNMEETLEESIRSIIDQVTDEFEVFVVDDGSDDGSSEILQKLNQEYDNFRFESLEYDENRHLGITRNISFKLSKGEYILESLDTDDRYNKGIMDFVEVFHQLEEQLDFKFYLNCRSINMAPKELLLEFPYRNLERAEDTDLWKRLFAAGAMIKIEQESFCETIGYKKTLWDKIKCNFQARVNFIQTGISFWGNNKWRLFNAPKPLFIDLLTYPLAHLVAKNKKHYDLPPEVSHRGDVLRKGKRRTLSEIEDHYDVEIDKSKLSSRGKEIFYGFENES